MRKLKVLMVFMSLVGGIIAYSCQQETSKEEKAASGEKQPQEETASKPEIPEEDKELWDKAHKYFKPLPDVAEPEDYELTAEKVNLGKKLFYDPRLSKSGIISCNSCHNLASSGVDNLQASIGHSWQTGARNSPTVLNAALHKTQFWDGRSPHVEHQATQPILNPIEMAMTGDDVVIERLNSIPEYVDMFEAAFPETEDPMTYEHLGKAIGAFERTLMTPDDFDAYLEGDVTAMNEQQKRGLKTFIEVGCVSCHTGSALGGEIFQKFGVHGKYWEATGSQNIDEGRYEVTEREFDKYQFKVPGLRHITRTYPYFHDGSVWDLAEAIKIMGKLQLDKDLTDDQVNDIIAFFYALNGEIPEDARTLPELPSSTLTTSKPEL